MNLLKILKDAMQEIKTEQKDNIFKNILSVNYILAENVEKLKDENKELNNRVLELTARIEDIEFEFERIV